MTPKLTRLKYRRSQPALNTTFKTQTQCACNVQYWHATKMQQTQYSWLNELYTVSQEKDTTQYPIIISTVVADSSNFWYKYC